MYKEASKQKLRFITSRGVLTTEQLWDLNLNDLDILTVGLEDAYNNSKGKSFLSKRSTKDATIKLQFDISLDILQTKVAENERALARKSAKEHNQKILGLIAEKQDETLKGKSIKQLEAMLEEED